jgi:hypothetical protein
LLFIATLSDRLSCGMLKELTWMLRTWKRCVSILLVSWCGQLRPQDWILITEVTWRIARTSEITTEEQQPSQLHAPALKILYLMHQTSYERLSFTNCPQLRHLKYKGAKLTAKQFPLFLQSIPNLETLDTDMFHSEVFSFSSSNSFVCWYLFIVVLLYLDWSCWFMIFLCVVSLFGRLHLGKGPGTALTASKPSLAFCSCPANVRYQHDVCTNSYSCSLIVQLYPCLQNCLTWLWRLDA